MSAAVIAKNKPAENASADSITTLEQFEALYGEINPVSLIKETSELTGPYQRMIETAPFCTLASIGPGGLDVTPRGDAAPVVAVLDAKTLALPDRRGNNRIDTLRNIVSDPRVALLFLVPGKKEALRVNGRATISVASKLLESFSVDGKAPRSVLLIHIDTVYFQCGRAAIRSGIWAPASWPAAADLPTAGDMTAAAASSQSKAPETRAATSFDAKAYDAALPARQAATLY